MSSFMYNPWNAGIIGVIAGIGLLVAALTNVWRNGSSNRLRETRVTSSLLGLVGLVLGTEGVRLLFIQANFRGGNLSSRAMVIDDLLVVCVVAFCIWLVVVNAHRRNLVGTAFSALAVTAAATTLVQTVFWTVLSTHVFDATLVDGLAVMVVFGWFVCAALGFGCALVLAYHAGTRSVSRSYADFKVSQFEQPRVEH